MEEPAPSVAKWARTIKTVGSHGPRAESPQGYSASLSDAARKRLKILAAALHLRHVSTACTVRRLEVEHRFASFLSEWHEASVMFECGQTVGIVIHADGFGVLLVQHGYTINLGHARHPFLIGLHRAVQPYGVLQDCITRRFHLPNGKMQSGRLFG